MATGLIAGGYHGPPELTVPRVFTSWTLDVPVLLVLLLLAGLYVAGMRRVRRGGRPWPTRYAVAFCGGGLGAVVIATMSAVGVYQGVLFYVRAVQTILLLLAAPLFLDMGRPLSLAIAALPRAGPRIEAAVAGKTARVLTFPLFTSLLLLVVPFTLYFTSWYEAGLRSGVAREFTYLALIVPGLFFFWTLLRVDPVPRVYAYTVSLWVSAVEIIGDAVFGLAVAADPNFIAGAYYRALARPWGPGLRVDQMFGGGTLLVLGDVIGLPFLAVMLIHMIREDEGEAARIDAEIDAEEVALAAAADGETPAGGGPGAVVTGADGPGPDMAGTGGPAAPVPGQRPWWESDARFSGRFRPPPGD